MARLPLALAAAFLCSTLVPAAAPAASRCSPSGDVCWAAYKRGGAVYLRIGMQAKYFSRYRLCVRPLGGQGGRECKRFRVHRRGDGTYASRVRWSRHFTNHGKGRYRATWAASGNRLGALTFTR